MSSSDFGRKIAFEEEPVYRVGVPIGLNHSTSIKFVCKSRIASLVKTFLSPFRWAASANTLVNIGKTSTKAPPFQESF